MVCGNGSSSITSVSPLGIIIQFPTRTLLPPCTSLSTLHAHTSLAAAPAVSASSLTHHHRTIRHLSFVGGKERRLTHQTNMSGANDDYDPQIDGNDDNLLAPSVYEVAEDFVY
jgi:hypothetical protein